MQVGINVLLVNQLNKFLGQTDLNFHYFERYFYILPAGIIEVQVRICTCNVYIAL